MAVKPMQALLGVFTCDKCNILMRPGQSVIVIAEGYIVKTDDEEYLTFRSSCIRYACHLDCWDGVEENYSDEF